MKICVFGAGAIGGHLAARLAEGGAEVSVIARGANLAAISEHGLTVTAPDRVMHHRLRAAPDAAALGPQDAVIVTTKAPALPSVAAGIGPLLGPDTSVAFVMNGIQWWYFDHHGGPMEGKRLPELDPGEVLRQAVGIERTIGGVVYSACTVVEPGRVNVAGADNRVILGEPDGRESPRAEAIAAVLRKGGMACPVSGNIREQIWAKLMGNLAGGPTCLLTRRSLRDSLTDPVVRANAVRMLEEAQAIAAAYGLTMPSTPEERIARSTTIHHKPSILQDLEQGRPMEIDALFTVPLAMGRAMGVPTPVLDLMVALARQPAVAAGLYTPR